MKKIITIILIVTAAVIVVTVAISILFAPKKLTLSQPIGANMRFAQPINQDEIYYFNGSAFMKYKISSQSSEALTPQYTLPNITEVRWSPLGVLFKASSYSDADQLLPVIKAKQAAVDASFWWIADFKNGAISLVGNPDGYDPGTVVEDCAWSLDGSYAYIQNATSAEAKSSSVLVVVQAGKTTQFTVNSASQILSLSSSSSLYIGGEQAKLQKLTFTGGSTELMNLNGYALASPAGDRALILQSKKAQTEGVHEASGELSELSIKDKKSTLLQKQFSGSLAWSRLSEEWAALDSQGQGGQIKTDKKRKYKLSKGKNVALPNTLTLVGIEGDMLYLRDIHNTLYIAASNLPALKVVAVHNPEDIKFPGSTALLNIGLTSDQLLALQSSSVKYSTEHNLQSQAIEISNVIKTPHDRNSASTANSVIFQISYDGAPALYAEAEYIDLDTVHLTLFSDANRTQRVFDGGNVNSKSL